MKTAPIIISRTKSVDYNGFFCLPADLMDSKILMRIRNTVYANDLHLNNGDNRQVRVIISDKTHVIIGIISIIEDIIGKDIDLHLDNYTSKRTLWGFIGGAIKINDFRKHPHAVDLDSSFFRKAFMEIVYAQHWMDGIFEGPYISSYEEAETIDISETESPFPLNEQIISSEKNIQAVNFILNAIHDGKNLSLVTNADYSATKSILNEYVDFASVSIAKVEKVRIALKEKQKAKQSVSSQTPKHNVKTDHMEFQQKLHKLCEQYQMKLDIIWNKENRKLIDKWVVTNPDISIKKEGRGYNLFDIFKRHIR